MGAMLVPRVNIQWKKATRNRRNVKHVLSDSFKICLETPRALNAPVDLPTKPKVQQRAMRCLRDPTVGTVKYVNVKQVIIAPVKPPTKPLVILGRMQPVPNQFRVLNVRPERTRLLLVPQLAKIVTTMHINRNSMRRNAFQCKKGSTNPAQQLK